MGICVGYMDMNIVCRNKWRYRPEVKIEFYNHLFVHVCITLHILFTSDYFSYIYAINIYSRFFKLLCSYFYKEGTLKLRVLK